MEIRHWYNNSYRREARRENKTQDNDNNKQQQKNLIHNSKRLDCDYIFNDWKQVSILLLMSGLIN